MTQHFRPSRAPLSEEPEPLDPGYDPAEEGMTDEEWASLLEEPRLGQYVDLQISHLYQGAVATRRREGKA